MNKDTFIVGWSVKTAGQWSTGRTKSVPIFTENKAKALAAMLTETGKRSEPAGVDLFETVEIMAKHDITYDRTTWLRIQAGLTEVIQILKDEGHSALAATVEANKATLSEPMGEEVLTMRHGPKPIEFGTGKSVNMQAWLDALNKRFPQDRN